ncbi:hypothetical protein GUJ93_ZPchr0012g22069 [Zizania palustris]|uniref:Uncharacterized protein n=1 Tax=Zizania palustris TaxID=103762 RepID=A0A8J6BWB1_ZIZPA|nr:hypothetical protein GUJ93_ZPchr0012g22069 [Zizania palustris]
MANASSQKPNKQTNKKNTDEGSDSSKYLPGAKEGQEDQDECVNTSLEKETNNTKKRGRVWKKYSTNIEQYRTEEQLDSQPENNSVDTMVQGKEEHDPPILVLDWSVFDDPGNTHEDEVPEQLEVATEGQQHAPRNPRPPTKVEMFKESHTNKKKGMTDEVQQIVSMMENMLAQPAEGLDTPKSSTEIVSKRSTTSGTTLG